MATITATQLQSNNSRIEIAGSDRRNTTLLQGRTESARLLEAVDEINNLGDIHVTLHYITSVF